MVLLVLSVFSVEMKGYFLCDTFAVLYIVF